MQLRTVIALTVGLRSAQSEIEDIDIADHRQKERVMDADLIRNPTLCYWNYGATDDCHDHHARSITRERPKFGDAEGEDAGEHDRIEKADKDNAVHGNMSACQHRDGNQRGSAYGTES